MRGSIERLFALRLRFRGAGVRFVSPHCSASSHRPGRNEAKYPADSVCAHHIAVLAKRNECLGELSYVRKALGSIFQKNAVEHLLEPEGDVVTRF